MNPYLEGLISPHFKRWEFVVSETATRRGIGNSPSSDQWARLQALAENVLEPARAALGPLRITSGYRSPALNVAIGGAEASQHCRGEAADVIPLAVTLSELFAWLQQNAPFDQLIWEFGSWVHVSYMPKPAARHEMLLAYKKDGKTIYAPISDEQAASMA